MSFPNKYGSTKNKAWAVMECRGFDGSLFIADTAAHVGSFINFTALTDTVGAFVSSNIQGTLTAVTIKAGSTLYGRFSSITLASGTGQAFLG